MKYISFLILSELLEYQERIIKENENVREWEEESHQEIAPRKIFPHHSLFFQPAIFPEVASEMKDQSESGPWKKTSVL